VDDKGDIYAEGADELIYGRLSNVLQGGKDALQTQHRPSPIIPQAQKSTTSPLHAVSSDGGYKAYTWSLKSRAQLTATDGRSIFQKQQAQKPKLGMRQDV
jgi:hypothetical protein